MSRKLEYFEGVCRTGSSETFSQYKKQLLKAQDAFCDPLDKFEGIRLWWGRDATVGQVCCSAVKQTCGEI